MEDLNDKLTGGTLTAAEWNQVPSEIQNAIESAGITLLSGDLNQLGKALAGYVSNGNFYTDSGAADAYVLGVVGAKQRAPQYTDGFTVSFIASNENTGASTVNVAALGVKNIKTIGDHDVLPGDIRGFVTLRFSTDINDFILDALPTVVNVRSFGASADGVTDDLPAFQAAKNYLDSRNGGVIIAYDDLYLFDGELTLDTDNIIIEGKGSGFHHDAAGAPPVTRFAKTGVTTTPVVNITSASTFKASGSGLRKVRVDGNLIANTGLQVKSHNKYILQDVYVTNALSINANFTVKTGMSEAADNQYGAVDGFYTNSGYPDSGTAADAAEGMVFDGDASANTSLNLFKNLVAFHTDATGFRLANCDNNEFINMRSVRFVASTGSNNGLTFGGGATATETARANNITGLSSKEIFAEGTTTKAVASYSNRVLFDRENFSTVPVVDTGASLIWKNELIPATPNVIQHDNGWYEVWGLETGVAISSTAVVTLPFSFDATTDMHVYTTIRSTYVAARLGAAGGFANAVNQITIGNTESATALDIAWRVIGKKTS